MKLVPYHNSLSEVFGPFFRDPFAGFGRFFDLANQVNRYSKLDLGADLYEDDENYYARVELPGVKRDDLKLELNDGVLSVGFTRNSKLESDEGSSSEDASIRRVLRVPEGVDPEKVSAKLEDGILTVALPKPEVRKPRSIKVK